jgi:putative DNA-invertase from lambdoid prophage Rac
MSTFAYLRVSTAAQAADGESLGAQQRKLEGYAAMHDLTIDEVFVERGVSGGTPIARRPEGARLLERLQPGDVVVATKLDRVFRSALDALQTCEAFRKQGVSLHLLDLGGDVTGNGIAALFMKVASAFADFERERISERIADVKRDQRDRGLFLGGHVPFGSRKVDKDGVAYLEPEPEQQAAIRTMRELAGSASLRQIAAAVRERHGIALSYVTVRAVLAREPEPEPDTDISPELREWAERRPSRMGDLSIAEAQRMVDEASA